MESNVKRQKTTTKLSALAILAVVASSEAAVAQQNRDVLTLDDREAATRLTDMAATGDLSIPGHAGAWVVLSSVALGVGRDVCALPEPPDPSFIVTPALDGMAAEQITVLNRMVTENYRSSEIDGMLDVDELYPITRQAVAFLGWHEGRYDCGLVAEVWNVALNYARNRSR